MLFRMAARNLWRAKRRTLITLFTVAFGVWLGVTFTGTADYSYTNMLNTGARMGFGHVTVEGEGYAEAPGLDRPLLGATSVAAALAARPDVARAIPRVVGQAMFATASKSVGGMFLGVDPAQESPEVDTFLAGLVEGELFTDPQGRGVVVGAVMAEKLDLRLGKRVVYTLVDREGEIVSEVARVSGIFKTGVDEVDGSLALLPLGRVQAVVGYGPEDATHVAVFLADHRRAGAVAAALAAQVTEGQEVRTYRDTQPELAGLIEVDRTMNYFFQVLVGILIGAGVLNTILMSVLERRREFGVMMAIGARPGELFRMVVMESLLVGLLGLVLGAALTTPWYLYMRRVGLDFSAMMEGSSAAGVLLDPVVRITLYPESVVGIAAVVLLITVLAGLYPAWQAGREAPVETLKAL
jgi:ABC-type lipoprotein release transport system permease subunit